MRRFIRHQIIMQRHRMQERNGDVARIGDPSVDLKFAGHHSIVPHKYLDRVAKIFACQWQHVDRPGIYLAIAFDKDIVPQIVPQPCVCCCA